MAAAVLFGLATFVGWYFFGATLMPAEATPLVFALTLAITVVIIACLDALGLSYADSRDGRHWSVWAR